MVFLIEFFSLTALYVTAFSLLVVGVEKMFPLSPPLTSKEALSDAWGNGKNRWHFLMGATVLTLIIALLNPGPPLLSGGGWVTQYWNFFLYGNTQSIGAPEVTGTWFWFHAVALYLSIIAIYLFIDLYEEIKGGLAESWELLKSTWIAHHEAMMDAKAAATLPSHSRPQWWKFLTVDLANEMIFTFLRRLIELRKQKRRSA